VQDRSFIVRNQNNEPIRLIGAMKDVTKLRSFEKELVKKQLRNKNKLGKTIILSHENERRKIKDDLHEDVNQMLASIKIYMTDLKSELHNEALTTSLHHLDDAIQKINKISNTLSSSTFEFFGLTEAVTELIINYKKESKILFEFDALSFDEDKTDKEINLLLYRIIEDKLSLIINNTDTKKIHIQLTNNSTQAILRISFQKVNGDIKNILNDSALTDIDSKIEMYEGTMKMISGEKDNYTIEIFF
jgi:two-component system sensor histidine kinase UhpB